MILNVWLHFRSADSESKLPKDIGFIFLRTKQQCLAEDSFVLKASACAISFVQSAELVLELKTPSVLDQTLIHKILWFMGKVIKEEISTNINVLACFLTKTNLQQKGLFLAYNLKPIIEGSQNRSS
ncbi:hypothetical protein STEG23_010529, partial [Scotinomys teguina]